MIEQINPSPFDEGDACRLHYFLHFQAVFRLVAVVRTFLAYGFRIMGADEALGDGILQELLTIRTEKKVVFEKPLRSGKTELEHGLMFMLFGVAILRGESSKDFHVMLYFLRQFFLHKYHIAFR
jgi:hypothetical protein